MSEYLAALLIALGVVAASSFVAWITLPPAHVDADELVRRWKERSHDAP